MKNKDKAELKNCKPHPRSVKQNTKFGIVNSTGVETEIGWTYSLSCWSISRWYTKEQYHRPDRRRRRRIYARVRFGRTRSGVLSEKSPLALIKRSVPVLCTVAVTTARERRKEIVFLYCCGSTRRRPAQEECDRLPLAGNDLQRQRRRRFGFYVSSTESQS